MEIKTVAIQNRKRIAGNLHLDSKSLMFRSKEMKWELSLSAKIDAKAKDGNLHIKNGQTKIVFEIGETAPKWVEKILNPPNRIKKLGVKPDNKVWLSSGFGKSFRDEIKAGGARLTRKLDSCDLAIWKVMDKQQLEGFDEIAMQLPHGVNLWIVWPKGVTTIAQADVMSQTRSRGFGPSKTASFDDHHSSMRFGKPKLR